MWCVNLNVTKLILVIFFFFILFSFAFACPPSCHEYGLTGTAATIITYPGGFNALGCTGNNYLGMGFVPACCEAGQVNCSWGTNQQVCCYPGSPCPTDSTCYSSNCAYSGLSTVRTGTICGINGASYCCATAVNPDSSCADTSAICTSSACSSLGSGYNTVGKCVVRGVTQNCCKQTGTPSSPSCSVTATPSSGNSPLTSSVVVSFSNFSYTPTSATVSCGSGFTCYGSGQSGGCNSNCVFTSLGTNTITASIDGVTCTSGTVTVGASPVLGSCTVSVLPSTGPIPFTTTVQVDYSGFSYPPTSGNAATCGNATYGMLSCTTTSSGTCTTTCVYPYTGFYAVNATLNGVACTYGVATPTNPPGPSCTLNASPSSGDSPLETNITVNYYNFSSGVPAVSLSYPNGGATELNTMSCSGSVNGSCSILLDITNLVTIPVNYVINGVAMNGSTPITCSPVTLALGPYSYIPASCTLSPTSASLNTGSNQSFSPACKDLSNYTVSCPSLTWTSSNTSVGTIYGGLFFALSGGSTTVTATSSTATPFSCSAPVTVTVPVDDCSSGTQRNGVCNANETMNSSDTCNIGTNCVCCVPDASKSCFPPAGKVSYPTGSGVIRNDSSYSGADRTWSFVANVLQSNLGLCQWSCNTGYEIDLSTNYSCKPVVPPSTTIFCPDLGLNPNLGEIEINASDVVEFSLFVFCNPIASITSPINLTQIEIFDLSGNTIKTISVGSTCGSVPVEINTTFPKATEDQYSYKLTYGGLYGTQILTCFKEGSFYASKLNSSDANVPDASPLSILVVIVIVLSIVILRGKENWDELR